MAKWVKAKVIEREIGISAGACAKKRENGVWAEGQHYTKAPDNTYFYNVEAIEDWIEGVR